MLSDFGQARAIVKYTATQFKTTSYYRKKGTVNWMAPEIAILIDDAEQDVEVICTKASDMWAYRMVILVRHYCLVYLHFLKRIVLGSYYSVRALLK